MNKIIKTINLNKSYYSSVEKLIIFKNLNFSLDEGKSLFLFGPSGCGKSTFLNMITGLDNPDSGDVLINNKILKSTNSSKFLKHDIGIIFQDHYLLSELNVRDNLMIKSDDKNQLEYLIDFLDISDIKFKYPYQISNGQKQRVCVARSLINKPILILADEMTGNLDEKTADNIIIFFLNFIKKNKISLIYATHNNKYARMANTQYELKDKSLKLT